MKITRTQMLARLGDLRMVEGDGGPDAGGSVAAGEQASTDGQDGAQQAVQQSQDDKDGEGDSSKQSPYGDWQMADLPEGVQRYIRDVRGESQKDRTTQQQNAADKARQEITESIAKALGLGDADPDKVTDQLSTITQERDTALAAVKAYETQKTIRAAATVAAIDADKALDLKATDQALEGINLSDTKAVQDALLKVAEQHPHIKAASTVGRTGGDHHAGEGNRPKPKDLNGAIGRHYE